MKCLHFGADSSAAKSESIFIKIPVSVTDSPYTFIYFHSTVCGKIFKFLISQRKELKMSKKEKLFPIWNLIFLLFIDNFILLSNLLLYIFFFVIMTKCVTLLMQYLSIEAISCLFSNFWKFNSYSSKYFLNNDEWFYDD